MEDDGSTPPMWQTVSDSWGGQGMSPIGTAGVLANIRDESNFNPTLRHPDQPNWGGEAHYAHGLYQEGGEEYNNYSKWLQQNHPESGGDWNHPLAQSGKNQSDFAAWNLKTNYPKVWAAMNNATSPGQAAVIYAQGYLKPAAGPLQSRVQSYLRGVPTLDDYASGNANYSPSAIQSAQGAVPSAAAPSPAAASPPALASSPAPQQGATSGDALKNALGAIAQGSMEGKMMAPGPGMGVPPGGAPMGNILPQVPSMFPQMAARMKMMMSDSNSSLDPSVKQNLLSMFGAN
jgi:hypothetical protein